MPYRILLPLLLVSVEFVPAQAASSYGCGVEDSITIPERKEGRRIEDERHEKAGKTYAQVSQKSDPGNDADDIPSKREQVILLYKQGEQLIRLGQITRGKVKFQEGLEVLLKMEKENAKDDWVQNFLWVYYGNLGDVDKQLGKAAESNRWYRKALAIARNHAEARPANLQVQDTLAYTLEKLGDLEQSSKKSEEAQTHLREAAAIFAKVAAAKPADSNAQLKLWRVQGKLGDVSLDLRQTPYAKECFEKCLAIAKKQVEAEPNHLYFRQALAISFDRLGSISLQIGDAPKAKDLFLKVLDVRTKLAQESPGDFRAQIDLVQIYDHLGLAAQAVPNHAEALKWYLEAEKRLLPLNESGKLAGTRYAELPVFHKKDIAHCKLVVDVLADVDVAFKQIPDLARQLILMRTRELARKDVSEAIRGAERLAAEPDPKGENSFFAALAFAYLAGITKEKQSHGDRAMTLLRQAKDRGCFELAGYREALRTDPIFSSIRQREDFKEVTGIRSP